MNQQKLNELAERAWAYQITVYEDNGVRTYGEQEKVFSKQKFAELIVRECCDIVHSKTDDSIRVVMAIEQHFGVEE
jgi:hypothetical protein